MREMLVPEAPAETVVSTVEEFHSWWAQRQQDHWLVVTRTPLTALNSWCFDDRTGNLTHRSGRFFSVEGLQVRVGAEVRQSQPIIHQPEIGVLGILVAELNGEPHCLMQAKAEPGNVNMVQLSPTVQATRSNYTRVHHGAPTRYLEYFVGPRRGEVLVDVLQSEQGAWFWHKHNRNMVVRVSDPVPAHPDFRWISLRVLRDLLGVANLVNMDARTVLSCMPFVQPATPAGPALHTVDNILSWFTEAKTWCDWHARLVPLAEVHGWLRTDEEIGRERSGDFRIVGVRVSEANREVRGWAQPVLEPLGRGLAVLVSKRINEVPHLLLSARPEYGLLDLVEMGPSVQLQPGQDPSALTDGLLRDVAEARVGCTVFDTVLSEEGGRFYHALTRYRVVEVDDEFPVDVPPPLCWLTTHQAVDLLRHGHYLNVEARTLLACSQSVR